VPAIAARGHAYHVPMPKKKSMRYHHIALYVSDVDEAYRLYRDLLGFSEVKVDRITPNPEAVGIGGSVLDDIFHMKDCKVRSVLLKSSEGSYLELLQPLSPPVRTLSPEQCRFPYTGIKELGLEVENIDAWFARIKAAGYETQTDYVWATVTFRSFQFFDADGNQVQLCENKPGLSFENETGPQG
jgi:catechol 2,3-dioxygenase-like lactoylglutathione lyase family enzyme